jgi:hypothetical protein
MEHALCCILLLLFELANLWYVCIQNLPFLGGERFVLCVWWLLMLYGNASQL